MSNIEIRNATLEDSQCIVDLFVCYLKFYGKTIVFTQAQDFVEQRLRSGDSKIYLAIMNGNACGFCQIYPSFSSLSMGKVWVINDLYVAEAYRRYGVAWQLLLLVSADAQSEGIISMVLETQRDNHKARSLYEKLGFKPSNDFVVYRKVL